MKTQKLIVIAAIVCLLVGASGAAMAKKGATNTNTCDLGVVPGEVVIGNLEVTSQDCVVFQAIIMGDVIVDNTRKGDSGFIFIMRDTIVNGMVEVTGGSAVISGTEVINSNLVVIDTIDTVVNETLVAAGNMRFESNERVLIRGNVVPVGSIRCVKNIEEYATQNLAPNGVVKCFGQ